MKFRRRASGDFDAEIESHIRLEADRLSAEGMSPEDAQDTARRAFGNVAIVRERFYESRRWLWLEQLGQDLRYAMRSLRKAPGFAVAAALTIALGVGANTAVFSLVDAVLIQSLPVNNPKELVFLETAGSAGTSGPPPYPCFSRLRAETSSFTEMAAFSSDELQIEVEGKPEQLMGQVASGNYFELLGVKAALGRLMESDDEKLNPPVAVISHCYWMRRFGGDPAVIGKTISFREQSFTIAGVTPSEFWGLQPGTQIDITLPITIERKYLADSGAWWLHGIIARLKPGVSSEKAQAESNVFFQSFMANSRVPADVRRNHFHHLELGPAAHGMDVLRRRFSKPLYALMGIVLLVMLMATGNIANLLLARGISRRGEFAVRLATGSGRARLVRQVFTETFLLFAFSAIPGVLLAHWAVAAIQTLFAQGRRAITLEADLNWHVLAFSLAVTLTAGLVSGFCSTWRALRIDPAEAIKEGQARTTESRGSATLTRTLIAFQVAVSLVLLVGAVTFARTLVNLRNVDLGFQNEQALTMSIELPEGHIETNKLGAIWRQVLEDVRAIRGVRAAALSTFTPLSGRDRGAVIRVRGYEPANTEDSEIHVNQVSDGYFEALGIPLLRGRLLTDRDTAESPRVVVLNEAAARKYFGESDPVGQLLEFPRKGSATSAYRIVGMVRDTKHMNLRQRSPRFAFIPLLQPRDAERRVTLALLSSTPKEQMSLVQPIRERLARVDPGLFVSDVITIRSQLDSTLLTERLLCGLSNAFGVLSLVLAAIGLYGVLNYRIGQQRRSIGIQIALGASPSRITYGVLRQSGFIVIAGFLAGLPFAFLAARMADSMLWGVNSSDPTIYVMGAALLAVVGFVSAYVPAHRLRR